MSNDTPKEKAVVEALEDTAVIVEEEEKRPRFRPVITQLTSNMAARADLSFHDAEYWKPLKEDTVQCRLCPNRCIIPDGFRGVCRVRLNVDGQLKTIVYGRVVAAHVDPIEKKPLFHFHPRSRSFSIATAGCNMNCLFCQNWQISQAKPENTRFMKLNPKDVVLLALQNNCESIAYTYTEPTIFFEFMRDTAKVAKKNNMKNVWITCGYIEEEPLRELCTYIDAANVDLKGFSEDFYRTYTTGKLKPVLDTFKILKEEGVWIELTNLLIPGANDSPQMISNLCAWIVKELGTGVPVHFSRFHPDYKLLDRPPTPVKTINRAVETAQGYGIKYVYAGNVAGSTYESTYCPNCGKKIITRYGYYISDIHIKDGKCEFCGTRIDGRW
jgi:pyruvate formate lyase activating enzyme